MAVNASVAMPRKLWEHPDPQSTQMVKFMKQCNTKRNLNMKSFDDLNAWSIGDSRTDFWQDLWDYVGLIHEGEYSHILEPDVRMDRIPRWFRGIKLNFAENLLYFASPDSRSRWSTVGKDDSKIACTEVREGCTEIKNATWGQIRSKVGRLASAMRTTGVRKGDRVAVVASNSVDTFCVFMAITSLGGIFSSSSTDMGTRGVLDRLLQIKPKWLFMDDGALYNGKTIDLRQKMSEIVEGMPGVSEFQGVVSLQRWQQPLSITNIPQAQTMSQYLSKASTDKLHFERVDFMDPFLIVYSSGTTGQPKCIVHSVGGVLISAGKEGILHRDTDPSSVILQYTTTGWIMYLSSILGMLHGVRVVMYDGSPFQPDPTAFVKLIGDQKVTKLGVSPKWMQTLIAGNIAPRQITNLSHLKSVSSTGMVLPESLFHWFYDVGFPPQAQLCNISGGTDLASCLVLENPLTPLYVGGCQGPGLGIPIDVYDSTIEGGAGVKGQSVGKGAPGELVATKAFPNMPVMFWPGDKAAMDKYWESYFGKYDNVWVQGDFVEVDTRTGQWVMLGRADGVLNPSGVRFGSAEIYNVVEKEFPKEIADSVVVGQRRPQDNDESVMLFLKMQPGVTFSPTIVKRVEAAISKECSKRHVPRYIFETPEIPTTVNMKKVELPVKRIVSGQSVQPSGTLLNPESLNFYYQFAKDERLQRHNRNSRL